MVAALFTLQVCAGLGETHRLCSVKVRDVLVLPRPPSPRTCILVTPHVCPCARVLPPGAVANPMLWGVWCPCPARFPLLP